MWSGVVLCDFALSGAVLRGLVCFSIFVWFCVVWCGLVWFCNVCCGLARFAPDWHDIEWSGVILYGLVRFAGILYGLV